MLLANPIPGQFKATSTLVSAGLAGLAGAAAVTGLPEFQPCRCVTETRLRPSPCDTAPLLGPRVVPSAPLGAIHPLCPVAFPPHGHTLHCYRAESYQWLYGLH